MNLTRRFLRVRINAEASLLVKKVSTSVGHHDPLKYFSIKELLSISVADLLGEVEKRSRLQYFELEAFPETRPLSILKSLYLDTIKNVSLFQGTHSLDARHGMVTQTIADAINSIDCITEKILEPEKSKEQMMRSIPSILRRQASISILLQHGLALTSSQHYCVTGCVVESDIAALCGGVKNQAMTLANHQFNWSPEISISIIRDDLSSAHSTRNNEVTCIPSFARFVLLETFKNALHATAETYLAKTPHLLTLLPSSELDEYLEIIDAPAVDVQIIHTIDSVQVRIKDDGYGMTAEEIEKSAGFMWASTIKPRYLDSECVRFLFHLNQCLTLSFSNFCNMTCYADNVHILLQIFIFRPSAPWLMHKCLTSRCQSL
jgi:hypothetical protein